jgi:hypothetical protein
MTDPEYAPTHAEILIELVRSRTSALGDKTWGMDELVKHSGLRPHQVSNAIARMRREANQTGEEPLIRVKTGARGQYVYTGPLKRGRKSATHAAEVPAEDFSDMSLLDMDTQLASEDTVVIVDPAKPKPTIAEGFAQMGEKMQAAFGDIRAAIGVPPFVVNEAIEAEKIANRATATAGKTNKISRIRRMLRDLESELHFLVDEWDRLLEKERRYDKITMTMVGFSSRDPRAVDEHISRESER